MSNYNYNYDPSGTTYEIVGTTYDTPAYDTGYGTTTYDPNTGAYDQHLDYETDDARRHHRERVDDDGVYRHRDVDRRADGSTRAHREYDNPNTGTSYHRDVDRRPDGTAYVHRDYDNPNTGISYHRDYEQ